MSNYKFGFLLAIWSALATVAGAQVSYVGLISTNTPPPGLKAQVKDEEMIGETPVHHAYLTYGTNQFSFILPDGYRLDCSNPNKLVVINDSYDCFMSFHVVSSLPADQLSATADFCRDLLLQRFPGAKITDQCSRTVANHAGPAFDFEVQQSGASLQSGRAIYVAAPAGILEFSLTSPADKFSSYQQFFNALLLTFRTNEGGKLQVVHYSSNI